MSGIENEKCDMLAEIDLMKGIRGTKGKGVGNPMSDGSSPESKNSGVATDHDWRFDTGYWHMTLNTGHIGLVDHSQPDWQVREWRDLKAQVIRALGRTEEGILLPGGLVATVSSRSANDGQMCFSLIDPKSGSEIIHGTYCADRSIEIIWWNLLMKEHDGRQRILPPEFGGKPWLAVGYHDVDALAEMSLALPLTWCQYEQLLVDAWQAMPSKAKAGLRGRTMDLSCDLGIDCHDKNHRQYHDHISLRPQPGMAVWGNSRLAGSSSSINHLAREGSAGSKRWHKGFRKPCP